MVQVTIRNLDNELLENLKARARLHHRSLEGELRVILAEAAKAQDAVVAEADCKVGGTAIVQNSFGRIAAVDAGGRGKRGG